MSNHIEVFLKDVINEYCTDGRGVLGSPGSKRLILEKKDLPNLIKVLESIIEAEVKVRMEDKFSWSSFIKNFFERKKKRR